jgi:hypothetical protein
MTKPESDKSSANSKDLAKELKSLSSRVLKLEIAFKKAVQNSDFTLKTKSVHKSPKRSKQESNNSKKIESKLNKTSSTKPKYVGKKGANIEAVVTETLDALVGDKSYRISGEDVVKNQLVMGDELLVELEKDKVRSVKVARRFKRVEVEGLVTVKDESFYAVSEHGVHKLINYDVKTKAVLKGFEVSLLLPKDKEFKAKAAIIKNVESSGNHTVTNTENINEGSKEPAKKTDPRVLQEDDLV